MYYERYMNSLCTSSGWASDASFAASTGCLRGKWNTPPAEPGVILYSHNGSAITDGGDECRHVLIIGATGTGKSRLVIMPSLIWSLRSESRRSYVVFDVKGELRAATESTARENNYKIININFRSPAEGSCWNPFTRANKLYASGNQANREKAWRLLEDIIAVLFSDGDSQKNTDPFWRISCANLFRGICSVLWETRHNISINAVLGWSSTIPDDSYEDSRCKLFRAADELPAPSVAHRALAGFRNGSEKTRGNVLCCFYGYLSPFSARNDVLQMLSSESSVSFKQLGETPSVLYITLPDDSTALGSLEGILLTQLMQELNECALENSGRLPVRAEIYLDELCNIKPAIPSLETALTISRSRGIRYILAIQSYAQLCGVYGAAAETISANCSTWIAMNIAKDETFRKKLSELCGKNELGDPLITPSQLSLLSYEQAIVIRERCAPYFTRLEDIGRITRHLTEGHAGSSPA
ncbi:MAG: type IV secretory system conjugative DNA transfer family protein [Clostridia bacterium]|nr:type IV secretory system conjugative DNA transfer family protein [Clostridia bacterium]